MSCPPFQMLGMVPFVVIHPVRLISADRPSRAPANEVQSQLQEFPSLRDDLIRLKD